MLWSSCHDEICSERSSKVERDAQNKEARQMRVTQLRKMLQMLVHASQCKVNGLQTGRLHSPSLQGFDGAFLEVAIVRIGVQGCCERDDAAKCTKSFRNQ